MESRQRRERRRQVKKQRGRKRLLVILLLLVIGLGACSLRQILRNSPTAVTEPAMTEEGPATDESAESTEDKTEPADDETEASEQTETEDTEDATEDAAANLPDETAFETKLQGFSRPDRDDTDRTGTGSRRGNQTGAHRRLCGNLRHSRRVHRQLW